MRAGAQADGERAGVCGDAGKHGACAVSNEGEGGISEIAKQKQPERRRNQSRRRHPQAHTDDDDDDDVQWRQAASRPLAAA